jgi:hypothetical protein
VTEEEFQEAHRVGREHAEMLTLLRRLTTEIRVMIGNKEKVYFAALRATEDGEALLKRLEE